MNASQRKAWREQSDRVIRVPARDTDTSVAADAEIDEDLIEAYRGTVSLPFAPGANRRIAVKIVDDRGIESLRVMEAPW